MPFPLSELFLGALFVRKLTFIIDNQCRTVHKTYNSKRNLDPVFFISLGKVDYDIIYEEIDAL